MPSAVLKENISLAEYTTFKIGGKARFFIDAKSVEDIKMGLRFVKQNNLPIFILGGGSNVLISDKGFPGLVIRNSIKGIHCTKNIIYASGGDDWDTVVAYAVKNKLSGIENLSLIPGTMGGAVYQNIGAYGAELSATLLFAKAINLKNGKLKKFSNKECGFGYRKSVFQKYHGQWIIIEVALKLNKKFKPNVSYPDLKSYFEKRLIILSAVRKAVICVRRAKLAYPDVVPNAGSFFKNLVVSTFLADKLSGQYPNLKIKKTASGFQLSAGQLIEMVGWKGRRCGNVGVSDKHALVIVNYGDGTARQVTDLSEKIRKSVFKKFSVNLEPEVVFV